MNRYEKQILFHGIGEEGQKKLKEAKVAIIGCGALGTVIADNLARAGVGFIRIADRDYIELSNLQRQTLFDEEDIKQNLPKAVAAQKKLERINSYIEIEAEVLHVNSLNIEKLCKDVDLILDATDNFNIRFLINDVAIKLGIPWVYGGVIGSTGVLSPIIPGETPCLRCIIPDIPDSGSIDTCDTIGVLNGITNIIASYQATEALKILTGQRENLIKGMLYIDVWENTFEFVSPSKKESCITCGDEDFEFLTRKEEDAVSLCGKNSVQINPYNNNVSIEGIAKRLDSIGITPKRNSYFMKFTIEEGQFTLFYDGRAIIKNVTDLNRARSLYSKYIGY